MYISTVICDGEAGKPVTLWDSSEMDITSLYESEIPSSSLGCPAILVEFEPASRIIRMFTKNSTTARSTIKKYLIAEGVKYECKICGQGPIWNDLPLILELDHVNGERTDNTKENLRLLCPQCHSQQKTSSRNKRIGVHKISDSAILESLKNSRSVREAIVKLGCLDSGPAYVRVRKIMRESGFVYTKAAQDVDTYWRTKPKPEMRKVVRPSKEVLEAEVKTTNFSALGRKYGVSDNAIRKWCKTYKII